MLETVFNSKAVELLMLHLYHYGEVYAYGLARDTGMALSGVQKQLARLEAAGLLVSREVGKTRVYTFNPKSPYVKPLKGILQIAYETLPLVTREKMFAVRRRPRRAGKPVLKS